MPQAREGDAANDADLNRVTPVGKTFGPARIQFLSLGLTPESDNGKARLTLGCHHRGGHKTGTSHGQLRQSRIRAHGRFRQTGRQPQPLRPGFRLPAAEPLASTSTPKSSTAASSTSIASTRNTQARFTWRSKASLSLGVGPVEHEHSRRRILLLVIITADGFKPIPIGFGFMLAGIGGLLGIHRTVNEDAVQAGVGQHAGIPRWR